LTFDRVPSASSSRVNPRMSPKVKGTSTALLGTASSVTLTAFGAGGAGGAAVGWSVNQHSTTSPPSTSRVTEPVAASVVVPPSGSLHARPVRLQPSTAPWVNA
jgi:hypothetical protein